jgi:hypothetical protein
MLSEIVRAGVRQNFPATRGGTTARHAITIQFETDLVSSASAVRHTTIAQVAKSCIFLDSEYMRPV